MGLEIERKFLLSGFPLRDESPGRVIEQGYLAIAADGTEVRLRRSAGRCQVGIKVGVGLVRTEVELDLAEEDFEALWPATAGRRVDKTRYAVQVGGTSVEVDVYQGALEGLLVAEVEFPSTQAAAAFRPPGWFGREVTGSTRYRNQELAVHGLPADG